MIDTLKVQIPLTASQHTTILEIAANDDRDCWGLVNLQSGNIRFIKISGLAETDQHSYHRDIRWDVSLYYVPGDTWLTIELSLPKLYYGDNIRLLHEPAKALTLLEGFLNQAFGFKTRRQLPTHETWKVLRADFCYCWKFPSQALAQHFLDSLKTQRFPYKKPTIRETSISFTSGKSSTYSAKFYLKLPEFLAHDAKAIKKSNAPLSEIEFRKKLAEGILRFEITCRLKWLRRNEINLVSDLINPVSQMIFDNDLVEALQPCFNPKLVIAALTIYHIHTNKIDTENNYKTGNLTPLNNGMRFEAPPTTFELNGIVYEHPGGGFQYKNIPNVALHYLQQMLEKFVSGDGRMAVADRVREKLLAVYRPSTAANLTAFWLYIQKFGSESAKEVYGKTAYYYKLKQLKKAKVSTLESNEHTIILGKDFFEKFSLTIPSDHVGNRVDDERDSINILNLTGSDQGNQGGDQDNKAAG